MTAHILVGAALGLAFSSAALAQSYTAPAGISAATAPGGLDGKAAAHNIRTYHHGRGGSHHGHASRPGPVVGEAAPIGAGRGPLPQRGR